MPDSTKVPVKTEEYAACYGGHSRASGSESHLREFLEQGFEVAVVRDAVAAPKLPEGDGYGPH